MTTNAIANLTSVGTGAVLTTQTEDYKPMIISLVVALLSELFKFLKKRKNNKNSGMVVKTLAILMVMSFGTVATANTNLTTQKTVKTMKRKIIDDSFRGQLNGEEFDIRRVNGKFIPTEKDNKIYRFDISNSLVYGDLTILLGSKALTLEILKFNYDNNEIINLSDINCKDVESKIELGGMLLNGLKLSRSLEKGEAILFDGYVLKDGYEMDLKDVNDIDTSIINISIKKLDGTITPFYNATNAELLFYVENGSPIDFYLEQGVIYAEFNKKDVGKRISLNLNEGYLYVGAVTLDNYLKHGVVLEQKHPFT